LDLKENFGIISLMGNFYKKYIKFEFAVFSIFAISAIVFLNYAIKTTVAHYTGDKKTQSASAAFVIDAENLQADEVFENTKIFEAPSVKAKAYEVYDAKFKKVISSKNSKNLLPLASITKIFTAVAVADILGLDSTITIKDTDLETEGDSGLVAGSQWRTKDLLQYMLFVSSLVGFCRLRLPFNI